MGPKITFFIPCLNEVGNIGRAMTTVVGVMREIKIPYELVIIDDASTDDSVKEIKTLMKKYPEIRIELIQNKFCRGLGRNYFIAAQRAAGEYFMIINGDAAEPPETIKKIITHLGKADAIVPYFGLNDSRTTTRRAMSAAFTTLVSVLSGYHLKYYNGPVLHKTENVRAWFAETAGFGYQAELLCRLLDEGISIKEIQVTNSDRERGFSKAFRLHNLLSVANTLFHIGLHRCERLAFRLLTPEKNPRSK